MTEKVNHMEIQRIEDFADDLESFIKRYNAEPDANSARRLLEIRTRQMLQVHIDLQQNGYKLAQQDIKNHANQMRWDDQNPRRRERK